MPSPAMQTALDQIWREFARPNLSHVHNARTTLKVGARDPEIRARYGWIVFEAPHAAHDIGSAIAAVSALLANERALHARSARAWGNSIRPRLREKTLAEALFCLRWLRRKQCRRFADVALAMDVPSHIPLVA